MIKKICLVCSMMVATAASAELKELNDEALSEVEGQAGVTIDIEFELSIGEIAWMDGGSVVAQGIRIGGNSNESQDKR